MKRIIHSFLIALLLNIFFISLSFASDVNVYRVYNSGTGEHLYTTDANEVSVLTQNGWNDEGTGWVAPDSGDSVIRLYNPATGLHLYTKDENEVNVLTQQGGWNKDNGGNALFFSGGSVPIYRLYSPITGDHHLTTDENEYNVLGDNGWNKENVGFYALSPGSNQNNSNEPSTDEKYISSMIVFDMDFPDGFYDLINYVDVSFKPEGSTETEYLGEFMNGFLIGTPYEGVGIDDPKPGEYFLKCTGEWDKETYEGSIVVTQAQLDNYEVFDYTSEELHGVSMVVPMRKTN